MINQQEKKQLNFPLYLPENSWRNLVREAVYGEDGKHFLLLTSWRPIKGVKWLIS